MYYIYHEPSPIRDTVVSVQQDTDKLDITLMVFFIQPDEEESDAGGLCLLISKAAAERLIGSSSGIFVIWAQGQGVEGIEQR